MKRAFFICFLFANSGCYSPKLAEKYLDNLYQHNPLTFRKKAQEYFPSNWLFMEVEYDSIRWKTYDSIYNRQGISTQIP